MSAVLVALVFFPALGAALAGRMRIPATARLVAIAAAGIALVTALVIGSSAVLSGGRAIELPAPVGGLTLLRADGAASVLCAVVAAVALGALVTSARRGLDSDTARSVLLGEAGTLLGLCAGTPFVLAVGWLVSVTPLWSEWAGRGSTRMARVVTIASTALLGLALCPEPFLDAHSALHASLASWRSGALVLAVALRAGLPPFQAWVPGALERPPVVRSVPVVVSPLAVHVLARHVADVGDGESSLGIVLLTVGTAGAVATALLALVQNDLRRALGYLSVSATATTVAALGPATERGLSGAVFATGSASLALACLAFLVEAVAVRTGTADMRQLGGLHPALPVGSAVFLVASLALVGFPCTSGFVAEDLVMQALVPTHPVLAVVLLATVALNGVTLYRSYARTFLGPPPTARDRPPERLQPRERVLAVGLASALVLGGVAPLPLVPIRAALETRPVVERGALNVLEAEHQ